ncbi:MAG TPA: wax ester/triacylglycerol synthase family O-acyltransferase [Solirubrobacterales bacterium]
MSGQAMPAADAAWLHMDRPTNPMVVNGLVRLAATPDPEAVAARLEQRLIARYPRFSRRVIDPFGRSPSFEDDPSFDLDNHLHRVQLSPPGDRTALQALVGELIEPQLDPSKPLWDVHLIEGYEGGAAMLWRIHHCIADGIALARVLFSLTDEAGADETSSEPAPAPPGPGALRRLAGVPARLASTAWRFGGTVAHEGMETVAHPDHIRELAGSARRDASTAAKLLASAADAPTALRGPLSGSRRVAWTEPFPLDRIKDAAHRRRVTVNDLLVTALAAALGERLGEDDPLPDEIHAMVPFNLRPLDEPLPAELGNDFALILLELPVGPVAPAERLREVSSRMDAIKRSHEAPIAFGLLTAMGLTPPWVEDRLIGFFTDKASLVVTNVPGPAERLSFAGAPIEAILVWAPCSGSLGMTVSIFSYAGEVTTGLMVDTALIPDPEPLARAYERELVRLCGARPAADRSGG